MKGEEPPCKRRRVTNSLLMLPDDLILNCLARVSRLYYPTLSLVSKKLRSFIASIDLYQTRTLLGRTENCLYVCLRQSNSLGWFTLCRRPNSSKMIFVPIPTLNFSLVLDAAVVVGPNIYTIGGYMNNNINASSNVVKVMDCRTHIWREAPSMHVARVFQSTFVFDGKIYVTGGRNNLNSTKWMEVFDTKTQTWEFSHIPSEEISKGFAYESVWYEGTIYMKSRDQNVTYKMHQGKWKRVHPTMNEGWGLSSSHCVIDNVFYCYIDGKINWYDSKKELWITLKGLERLLFEHYVGTMVGYGGKMVVFWTEYAYVKNYKETTVWCAEIAIEKRENGEIWGMVQGFDVVYTISNIPNMNALSLVHALVTTI
ncbi:F-box/kelch-repeat protein [Cardamine amara subsp. amara]|uniref:F-box/kelch-repeat protein n=1 Tax=Cardamine amara subsp. amara TaxID=228776 RepID=A0ABD1ACW4_CARAN